MRAARFLVVLLCILLASIASAAEPVFVVTGTDGKAREGAWRELGGDGELSVGDAKVAGGTWVTLRRAGQRLPAYPDGAQLLFTNGDRLPVSADKLRLADDKLTLTHALFGDEPVPVPLPAVVVFWVQPPDDGEDSGRLRRRLAAARRDHDVVGLRNGDLLEGMLLGLNKGEAEVEVARKKVPIALTKVSSVALSSELAVPLKPKGPHARLILDDGTRLTLAEARCDGKKLSGKTAFGAPFTVAVERVAALNARHDNVVYLSDLKPKSYEHTPYLALKWALAADGSVNGGDLRLPDGTHDKGLGMHSAGRVTYAVPQGCEYFEALVGLDERTGKLGSVQVRVEVDGKAHDPLEGKELTAQRGPVPVRIAVKGAKELTLVVEFGRGGDVGDHVNWADARFTK